MYMHCVITLLHRYAFHFSIWKIINFLKYEFRERGRGDGGREGGREGRREGRTEVGGFDN